MNGEAGMSRSAESSSSSAPPSAFSHTVSDRTSASSQPSSAVAGARQSTQRDSDKTGRSAPSVGLMTPPTPEDGYGYGHGHGYGSGYGAPSHVGRDSDARRDGADGVGVGVEMLRTGSQGSASASTSRPGSRARKTSGGVAGRASPPPPLASPPGAPPLPPASIHPFAQARAGYGAIARKQPPVGPLPSLPSSSLPPRSVSASLPGPAYPPPSGALPPLPSQAGPSRVVSASAGPSLTLARTAHPQAQAQVQTMTMQRPYAFQGAGAGAGASRPSSVSSVQSAVGIPVRSSSLTPPTSPIKTAGGINISPRNSSLYPIPQNGTPLDPPFQFQTQSTSRPVSRSQPSRHVSTGSTGTGGGGGGRTPSKLLLQSALELAQQAVELDRHNNVAGALEAYREAVRRLKDVIERVGSADRDKRRSGGRSEDEGRTLRGIHDAYVARIELLTSYEAPEESPPVQSHDGADPTRSTATLVPLPRATRTESPESGMGDIPAGERTPRPGAVDGQAGDVSGIAAIGNMMLSDPDESGASVGPSGTSLGVGGEALDDSPTTPMPMPRKQDGGQWTVKEAGHGHAHARSASQSLQEIMDRPDPHQTTPGGPGGGLNGSASSAGSARQADELPSPSKDKALPVVPPLLEATEAHPHTQTYPHTHSHSRQSSTGSLLDPTGFGGPSISQRRQLRNNDGSMSAIPELGVLTSASPTAAVRPFPSGPSSLGLPSSSAGGAYAHAPGQPMTARSVSAAVVSPGVAPLGDGPRLRAQSQPGGTLPPVFRTSLDAGPVPPVPPLHLVVPSNHLAPPSAQSANFSLSSPRSCLPSQQVLSASTGSLLSPLPEAQPTALVRRPFHLLRTLLQSMDPASPGAYLTGTVHISSAVWKPAQWAKTGASAVPNSQRALGPPKIQAQDVKVRVIEGLVGQYEAVRLAGAPLLLGEREGARGSKGTGAGAGAGRVQHTAEQMCVALEEGEAEMEAGWKMLSKAGVVVGGWKGKKSSGSGKWGARISKMTDKMTNSKAMESPDRYVDLLASLCASAQVIDQHLTCYAGPCTPAYHQLPEPLYRTLEARLVRQAEFVGAVVVPFVLDDFRQFFLRYLKGGIKYLED